MDKKTVGRIRWRMRFACFCYGRVQQGGREGWREGGRPKSRAYRLCQEQGKRNGTSKGGSRGSNAPGGVALRLS